MRQFLFLILTLAVAIPSLHAQTCVEFDEDDFDSGNICATEASNSGPTSTNAIDIWDETNMTGGSDGIPDVQLTYEAIVSNPNANGTCDAGEYTIGASWGGPSQICGFNSTSDFRTTFSQDCVCETGYIIVTVDFLNGFSSEASGLDVDWSSFNGRTESYEFGFGFVTAAMDENDVPITGLNSAADLNNIPSYCNAEYVAGTRISDHVLTSSTGVWTNQPDELNATANVCPVEDTGTGSGSNNSTDAGGISGMMPTDKVTQMVFVYGASNAPGSDCDGDGITGVDGNPGGSISGITVCPPITILPVELASFEGLARDRANELSWTSVSEVNVSHFEIQRFAETHFEEIGELEARGARYESSNYTFSDLDPEKTSRYRLKMIDVDGSYTFSSEVEITRNLNFSLRSIYPNPSDKDFTLAYEIPEEGNVEIKLLDLMGREISRSSSTRPAGLLTQKLDVSELVAGMYVVELITQHGALSRLVTVR